MTFELRKSVGKSTAMPSGPEPGRSPGKQTLTEALTIDSPAPSASGRAEYGGGELRAQVGQLAEGSHPGVKKGGSGKRRIGNINGGTFVPDASPAPAAAPASPTAAGGRDGERAYVGPSPRVADRTTNDGTTKVRIEDENDAQAAMIAAAVTRARAILDNAIAQIGSAATPKVAAALQANFHSTDAKVVDKVTSNLQRIRAAFNGTIPVEVESEGTARAYAYVYIIWSDVHLCPPWFADPDADGRARTIIHECSHKYTGTDDKAYHWDAKYATLSTKDALNNADSHAWFCIDVL